MILLVAAVLLVLLVGVAIVAAATGLARGDRRSRGDGLGIGTALAVPAAVAAGVVVLLVVAVFGLGGVQMARDPSPDTAMVAPAPEAREPVALEGPPARFDGRVSIHEGASPLRPLPIVGGLAAGDVVEVDGVGFLDHADGVVAQCANAEAQVCRNVTPIITDGEGRLRVPYRVEGPTSGEVVVVEVDFARGAARLAFGATAASPAVLTVIGGAIVAIRGASPGERVAVRRCDADATAVEECGRVADIIVAADGTASVPLDNASNEDARLTLVDGDGNVLAEPIVVEGPPGVHADVDLNPTQLLVGFSLALALLGIAITLIRTTDWRVPAEAATPLLDAATSGA